MRLYTLVFVFLMLAIVLPDVFFFLKLKKNHVKKFLHVLNFLPTFFFIIILLLMKFSDSSEHNPGIVHFFMWTNFFFILVYTPKLVYLIFHFLNYLVNLFLPNKIYLLRYAGVLTAMFVALLLAHGVLVNPKNIERKIVEVECEQLPAAFDGYKIVQISDIHLGSWGKRVSYLEPVIRIINNEQADVVVFTGDIVNNFSEEMEGWQPYFNQIKAKDGKFAVLGNHDYGDYSEWKNEDDKKHNLQKIKQNIRDFGFDLLLNEHVVLHQNTDSIELLGIENWGNPPFPKYGDLKETLSHTDSSSLKILLSHDPSHWKAEVLEDESIFLTLSGHTHAAQLAFNLYGKQRSPSSLMYKEWNGLYQSGSQFLYVNRGLGFIGIPVRIGTARPEVTVLILRSKK